jgi:hypothetical protein
MRSQGTSLVRWALIGSLVMTAAGSLLVWKLVGPTDERPEVAASLDQSVLESTDGVVDLREVAPFDWDRMYAFEAYTSDSDVSRVLGFDWGTGSDFRLPSEQFVLLVFAKERRVSGWTVLNEYSSPDPLVFITPYGSPIPRDEAIFNVEEIDDGWFELSPA